MGDRFYQQQLTAIGNCPVATISQRRRKRRMAWDDEKKAAVIEQYEAANPTPENSMEIVADLAEEFEESPNGVRMILTKAGVYVKKAPASGGAKGTTRMVVVAGVYQKLPPSKVCLLQSLMQVKKLTKRFLTS